MSTKQKEPIKTAQFPAELINRVKVRVAKENGTIRQFLIDAAEEKLKKETKQAE